MDERDDITPLAKACPTCGEVKPLDAFSGDRTRFDGRQWRCKACNAAHYAKTHPRDPNEPTREERRLLAMERARVASRAYYAENRDRERTARAAYRAMNRERERERARAWHAANPDKGRGRARVRRALKSAAPVVERVYRAKVWARDDGRCHICGRKADPNNWHLEHIVPLSRGGEHSYRNVAVSHPFCNLHKGTGGPGQPRLLLD